MKLRTVLAIMATIAISVGSMSACPTCTPKDASPLDNIVHGATPQGPWDYVIAAVMVALVVGTGYLSIRTVFKRGQA